MKREDNKKRSIIRPLLIFSAVLIAAFFIHFGGFSTGECADTAEFEKYAVSVEDLQVPEGVSVVAVGEATHGNREFQQLKTDVFRILVEKYGVRVFALEGDFGGCEAANRYIHGGEGTAEQAVDNIGFAIYRTDEMAKLMEYMRDFNESAAPGDDIRFYGFDMQRGAFSCEFLLEECKNLGLDTEKLLKLLTDDNWNPEYSYSERKDTFEEIRDDLISAGASDFAVHLADIMIQNCEFFKGIEDGMNSGSSNELRDSFMKDNIMWISEQEENRGNYMIFVSGHNGHVKRLASYDNTGSLLAEELGAKYYPIGTDFYKSRCNLPLSNSEKRRSVTFYSHDPLAKAAKVSGYDSCLLDFGSIPEDSSLKQYTGEYIYNGALGDGYPWWGKVLPQTYRVFDNPEISYDAMIYVAETTPTVIRDEEK